MCTCLHVYYNSAAQDLTVKENMQQTNSAGLNQLQPPLSSKRANTDASTGMSSRSKSTHPIQDSSNQRSPIQHIRNKNLAISNSRQASKASSRDRSEKLSLQCMYIAS